MLESEDGDGGGLGRIGTTFFFFINPGTHFSPSSP